MNLLVTGGAGYVGSVCARELLRRRHRVVVYDNLSTGHRAAVPPGAEFIEGDVADSAKVKRVCRDFQVTAAMHFAASALIDVSLRDPLLFYRNNVAATLALLEALIAGGVRRLVFSSTAAVYGDPQSIPVGEEHPTCPVNAYGDTKLAIEKALLWCRRAYGLDSVAMRYFNAAGGAGDLGENHVPETHLLPRLIDASLDPDGVFEIYGDDYDTPDGTCIRDFVHVLDIAQAHILALESSGQPDFRVFNIGSGHGFSIRETIAAAEAVTGKKLRIRTSPRRPGDPAVLVASSSKIRRELQWNPRHSDLHTIISSAWQWRRTHQSGYAARPA